MVLEGLKPEACIPNPRFQPPRREVKGTSGDWGGGPENSELVLSELVLSEPVFFVVAVCGFSSDGEVETPPPLRFGWNVTKGWVGVPEAVETKGEDGESSRASVQLSHVFADF
jgi:hypothetical protein